MKCIVYKDKKGEFRWQLRARNGRVLADGGEGYKRRRDCMHGIFLVRSLLILDAVFDTTVKGKP